MAAAPKQTTLPKSMGAKNDHDDEIFQLCEIDSAAWRLRDMAHRLLYHRYGPDSDTVAPRQSSSNMHMVDRFAEDSCLARLRLDRAGLVRNAFDAAATAILEATEKSLDQHAKKQRRKSLTFEHDDLPLFLTKWLKLEELRFSSLERAHYNKEYTKKPLPPDAKRVRKQKEVSALADSRKKKPAQKESAPKELPKFTRNTPASSAAALDFRSINSRAILCTAGNVCFDTLTPPLPGFDIDVTDIPQNPAQRESSLSTLNMGNVVVEAQALGQRAIAVALNASRRSAQRYQYRKDNLRFRFDPKPNRNHFFQMKNPYQWKGSENCSNEDETIVFEAAVRYHPLPDAVTEAWSENCLPRFLSILRTGGSHALYHDVEWGTRHGRIANLFQVLSQDQKNFGTHLIITTEPEVARFAQEFQPVNRHQMLLGMINAESLRALAYTGDRDQRRKLRHYFPKATGLVESPYHVLITSFKAYLEDYLHFCQMPYEIVVVDDGASWMAAARGDPNSPIGILWDTAIWSTKDHVGLAGTSPKRWDFTVDEALLQAQKEAWIGLTARNRVLTASLMEVQQRSSVDVVPVSGLVSFVAPHFATAVREEWDRSRIHTDQASMEHFRRLLSRSTVVHRPGEGQDMRTLAVDALNGRLPSPDRSRDPEVPEIIADETFVSDGKVAFSRRASLLWLGNPERSWLRYELGTVCFQPILNALSRSNTYGHFCEEVITASMTTSSGATGQVAGSLAYRLAVRCDRHFGSEQGLRQHLSALHAPPLTWLCRTCGTDCISSQSRTHHERSCGLPSGGAADPRDSSTGSEKGSRQHFGPVGVVGKKKGQRPGAALLGGTAPEDKDPDGSFRIPGYRGVWVNPKGKHFVKVKNEILKASGGDDPWFFDSIEEAAKGHDNAVKGQCSGPKAELNFQEDGTRIVYEDVTTSSTTGLGGSASNVVPALSVINIKDLPADVKPLLRDPRQTSRTGGNSKRHVYAYRGVCRQARKGHDRWQSQISFMGVNHYLGTFDSEWDAAAIYAWAHLILYGEEATRKAQKEGEEAAAAYEQEKKDIADGKILPPPPKPEKKRPKYTKKAKAKKGNGKKDVDGATDGANKKREHNGDDGAGEAKKKARPGPKPAHKTDKESIAPILAKGAARAWSLSPREQFFVQSDTELIQAVARLNIAAREANYRLADPSQLAAVDDMLRPCLFVRDALSDTRAGAAMLLGLSSTSVGWDLDVFVSSRVFDSMDQERDASSTLIAEFGAEGHNEAFRTLVQGPLVVIGNPSPGTRKGHKHLGLGRIPMGGAVGGIDCNIGGTMLSCSETAASIRYAPTTAGVFQFAALNDDDIVTLNGRRVTPGMGSFPLFDEDICTVGARVFVFLLPRNR